MTFDSRTEKNLATLLPKAADAARRFLVKAADVLSATKCTVKVISGSRTYAEQDALYAKGRTVMGPKVTNARGGYSNHNFGIAFDIGLFKGEQYLEETRLYAVLGPIGESVGLEWGGRWKTFTDEPHYQFPTGLTLAEMRDRVAKGKAIV